MSHIIMVFKIIAEYKLLLIFTPYFIFWLVLIQSLFLFFTLKLRKQYKIFYYPEDTEWLTVNFLFILPKRIAFDTVYFWKLMRKNLYSIENIKKILLLLLILLLIGIPIIILIIIKMLLKYKNIWKVWDELLPYKNLKMIFLDGKIIRNMKKTEIIRETGLKIDEFAKKGLTPLKHGKSKTHHASVEDKESGLGAIFTTKKQSKEDEPFGILEKGSTYGYVQKFGDNKNFIKEENIINPSLKKMLKENGSYALVISNKIIQRTGEKVIKLNENNAQKWVKLSEIDRKMSKNFIEKCGGLNNTNEFIKYHEHADNIINSSQKLMIKLVNSNKEEAILLHNKNRENFIELERLYKEGILGEEKSNKILSLLNKFEKILN